MQQLLATKGLLVEASPYDRVWGIGYSQADARCIPSSEWGRNLLGVILTDIRDDVLEDHIAWGKEKCDSNMEV